MLSNLKSYFIFNFLAPILFSKPNKFNSLFGSSDTGKNENVRMKKTKTQISSLV